MLMSVPALTIDADPGTPANRRPACRRIDDMDVRLRRLVDSSEPAIVFTSLVRLCVPAFSDACSVDIVEGGRVKYRIDYPQQPAPTDAVDGNRITTKFASQLAGWPSYSGVMTSVWHAYRPTVDDEDRAASIVTRAIGMILRERLADPVRSRPGPSSAASEPHRPAR